MNRFPGRFHREMDQSDQPRSSANRTRWHAARRLYRASGAGFDRPRSCQFAQFPWIAERERQGKLGLHGAYFGISKGTLLALDETSGRFEIVAASAHRAALERPGS